MNIGSNFAIALALGDLNRSNKQINKIGQWASSGMLLNSAADGSSDYSISEKMKTRIRCLNQDDQNVKTGVKMLQVAEGAIQSQINLMRTVKERVLAANNDTCTDDDRRIIQKEVSQAYDEIDDIAATTNYNGVYLLNGQWAKEKVGSWLTLDNYTKVKGSDEVDLIPDVYNSPLDGIEGPWDIFTRWTSGTAADKDTAYVPATKKEMFSDGEEGLRSVFELDLSGFTDDDIANGFFEGQSVFGSLDKDESLANGIDYVLTDTSKYGYKAYGVTPIKYDGITTIEGMAKLIADTYNSKDLESELFKAEAVGKKVIFTSKDDTNKAKPYGMSAKEYGQSTAVSPDGPKTGLFSKVYLTGGVNQSGRSDDDDNRLVPSKQAQLAVKDFRKAPADSGITIRYNGATIYLTFKDDDSSLSTPVRERNNIYYLSVGKYASEQKFSDVFPFEGLDIVYKDGTLTYKAPKDGNYYNNNELYNIEDGIPGGYWDAIKNDLAGYYTQTSEAETSKNPSHIESELALYLKQFTGTSNKHLESFIDTFKNTRLYYDSGEVDYEFIDTEPFKYDSKDYNTYDSVPKHEGATIIDLNDFREKFKKGDFGSNSVGLAAAEYIKQSLESKLVSKEERVKITTNGNGVDTITFYSNLTGNKGDGKNLVWEPTNLRSYEITNFHEKVFQKKDENGNMVDIPLDEVKQRLEGQGFRAYCASDSNQWFNFIFTNDPVAAEAAAKEKPKGDTGADIKSIYIDISNITDEESLITTIYDQAESRLETEPELNHFMRLAIGYTEDPLLSTKKATSLILYDKRNYAVRPDGVNYPWYQEMGAKIADGSMDDVVWGERDLFVKNLIIHHTDRSSANIRLEIPNTDLASIYGMDTDYEDLGRYNVLTEKNRERLLGTKDKEGAIDYAINYLTNAQTLLGAQMNHLFFANENITTQYEATTSAQSVIADADMAKVMTEYAKENVLNQAAQAMLSQSNRDADSVLQLLQG